MNKSRRISSIFSIIFVFLSFASCLSVNLKQMKDPELVQQGVDKWNQEGPESARPFWNQIKNVPLRDEYLAYIDESLALDADIEAMLAMPAAPDSDWELAFISLAQRFNKFPRDRLNFSDAFKPELRPASVEIVKGKVRAGKTEEAQAFIVVVNAFIGESNEYDQYLKENEVLAEIQVQEKSAEKLLVKARAEKDFDDRIKAYETAIAAYSKVDSTINDEIKKAALPEDSPLAVFQATVRKKRSTGVVEMEKSLRQRQASFNERIGEIFARTPEGDQLGNLSPQDLLKFYETIRTDINAAYTELTVFAKKYPKVIDKAMVSEIESEKANLDVRITQINEEIRKMLAEQQRLEEEGRRNKAIAEENARKQKAIADEFASRGKVALPLMIGLFNPMPGNSAESQKSRPAKMKGTITGDAEYWWGMTSIDKGAKDDLVVTMNDAKEVQVFADNPKKGAVPANMKNVVSMKDKAGKSWPVINASKYLVNERYYLQIKKNSTAAYSGEVVIYKSFISRMR